MRKLKSEDWGISTFNCWSKEEESVKEIKNGVVSEVKEMRNDAPEGKRDITKGWLMPLSQQKDKLQFPWL